MGGNRRARLVRGQRPRAGFVFSHRPAVRRNAVGQIRSWKRREGSPRGQRVLDGLSGARAGGRVLAALEMFNPLSFENEI
jgi:hypothetical protein